jgi:hypothetical protein
MSKYKNFCIYQIYHKDIQDDDNCRYIGSTTNFKRRKYQHKKNVKNKRSKLYNCALYVYIRQMGGWDNFIFEKIIDYPCETREQGLLKEKEYIKNKDSILNTIHQKAKNILYSA